MPTWARWGLWALVILLGMPVAVLVTATMLGLTALTGPGGTLLGNILGCVLAWWSERARARGGPQGTGGGGPR